ncbi:MAG: dTMP kinase, partial [Methermicoccaceae archaeon]
PDLTIILDVLVEVGLGRVNKRGMRPDAFEKEEYLERTRQIFLSLEGRDGVQIIDASRDVDDVSANVIGVCNDLLTQINLI